MGDRVATREQVAHDGVVFRGQVQARACAACADRDDLRADQGNFGVGIEERCLFDQSCGKCDVVGI